MARQILKPRHRIRFAFISLLWIGGICFCIAAAGSASLDRISKNIDESPRHLIYHTNHNTVLKACKEVLNDPQAAGFPKPVNGQATINGSQGGQPPANLPAVLKNLRFEFMVIDHHTATIYFGGGFGHWGYSTTPVPAQAQLELIPGLWFWSEYKLPRDISKYPYYSTSKRLLLGGVALFGIAIVLMIYSQRRCSVSSIS
jgi:hypothetical protein